MTEFSIDNTLYHGAPADGRGRTATEMACYAMLDRLGIAYDRVDHAPAATIALCQQVEAHLGAKICKNLFLCNRQKTEFYLLLMQGDKVFKTKYLSAQLHTARLSFADGADMERLLGLQPGSASVLGLMNDTERRVHLVIDRPVLAEEAFGCHPCVNTSTLRFSIAALQSTLLPALGHTATLVELPVEDV